MDTRFPVNHYLHLREQGVTHSNAVAHTIQRYGVTRDELTEALRQSRAHHLGLFLLLADAEATAPDPGMEPDSLNEAAWQLEQAALAFRQRLRAIKYGEA